MQSKVLIIFLAALAFLGSAYLLMNEDQSPPDNNAGGQRLFPQLEQQLNNITRIRVENGGNSYEVIKKNQQWQLPDKGGYPVLFERVKPLILGIALLEKVEPKTNRPKNYARLGVQEPSPDSGNLRLSLYTSGNDPVASLIIGGIRSGMISGGRDGIYARVSDQPRAWLLAGHLDLPQSPIDWVERKVIHIKPKEVRRVAIEQPDGSRLVIEKPRQGAPNYRLMNKPAGTTLKPGVDLNTLARGIAGLKMDDVLVRSQAEFPEAEAVAAVFDTWDGLRVTAYTVERAGNLFTWFDVGAVPLDMADLTKVRTTHRTDAELRSRLADWVYQLPRRRGEKLRTRLDAITTPSPDD